MKKSQKPKINLFLTEAHSTGFKIAVIFSNCKTAQNIFDCRTVAYDRFGRLMFRLTHSQIFMIHRYLCSISSHKVSLIMINSRDCDDTLKSRTFTLHLKFQFDLRACSVMTYDSEIEVLPFFSFST